MPILFVEKASPQQNGYIEGFHSNMRKETLDAEEFDSILEAKVVIGEWRELYNNVRRHRALGLKTPAAFRAEALKRAREEQKRKTDGGTGEGGR